MSSVEVCVPCAQDLMSNRERVCYSIFDLRKGMLIREITAVSEILTGEFASQVHHGRFSNSLFVKR